MKPISQLLRVVLATGGIVLGCYSAYLGLQTCNYLAEHTVSTSERSFQHYRLAAHILIFAIGIAMILLAVPIPRKNYVFHRGWQFYLGVFLMAAFVRGFLQFVKEMPTLTTKISNDDLVPTIAADIFLLALAVLLLKWKAKPVDLPE